jgi:hypothetical protein
MVHERVIEPHFPSAEPEAPPPEQNHPLFDEFEALLRMEGQKDLGDNWSGVVNIVLGMPGANLAAGSVEYQNRRKLNSVAASDTGRASLVLEFSSMYSHIPRVEGMNAVNLGPKMIKGERLQALARFASGFPAEHVIVEL